MSLHDTHAYVFPSGVYALQLYVRVLLLMLMKSQTSGFLRLPFMMWRSFGPEF